MQRHSGKTFLRLVTFDDRGKLHRHAITQKGFPQSALPPGAAPVLVNGRLHVVETYTSAAIDWGPTAKGGWEGQYLFASQLGSPQGRVGAVYLAPTLWSAWTQVYPETTPEDLVVLLSSSSEAQTTLELTHGIFVAIASGESTPEVAAYDWVTIADDFPVYAGLVLQAPGGQAWQLDGRLDGFAIARAGARQVLLFREGELQWFRSPGALPGIRLTMLPVDASGQTSGTVTGATGGAVQIYRELPHAARELVATSPVAADGSFHASGLGSSDDKDTAEARGLEGTVRGYRASRDKLTGGMGELAVDLDRATGRAVGASAGRLSARVHREHREPDPRSAPGERNRWSSPSLKRRTCRAPARPIAKPSSRPSSCHAWPPGA